MGRPKESLEKRFYKHITKLPNGCWEWSGLRNYYGYGIIAKSYSLPRHKKAHRASWEIHRGPIPDGLFVCHHCDNPPCCNPDHLFLGTCKDNIQDLVKKKRHCFGEAMRERMLKHAVKGGEHCCAKLTADAIRAIRSGLKEGILGKDFALEYGVSRSTICDIAKRRTWRHVE